MMAYERLLNKTLVPGEDDILRALGSACWLWQEICAYIGAHYSCLPKTVFFTKTCGWSLRYQKGKRTLCYLFPEHGAFSMLIILGREEVGRAEVMKEQMNDAVRRVLETTEQLHDGRWLWLRATQPSDVRSFEVLLAAKSKPKEP
jgi:hypothetical protein